MSIEYLISRAPLQNGHWNRENLEEYLIELHSRSHSDYIQRYFSSHVSDPELADMLFSVLSDEDCEGSDCVMGAARIISKLSPQLLRERKELLAAAQAKPVYAERPFPPHSIEWYRTSPIITSETWRQQQAQLLCEIGFHEEADSLLGTAL